MLTKDQIKSMPSINIAKCTKVDYANKKEALNDIKGIYTQRKFHSKKYGKSKKSGKKLSPYQCKRCGLWHITTSVNYRKAMKKERK